MLKSGVKLRHRSGDLRQMEKELPRLLSSRRRRELLSSDTKKIISTNAQQILRFAQEGLKPHPPQILKNNLTHSIIYINPFFMYRYNGFIQLLNIPILDKVTVSAVTKHFNNIRIVTAGGINQHFYSSILFTQAACNFKTIHERQVYIYNTYIRQRVAVLQIRYHFFTIGKSGNSKAFFLEQAADSIAQ